MRERYVTIIDVRREGRGDEFTSLSETFARVGDDPRHSRRGCRAFGDQPWDSAPVVFLEWEWPGVKKLSYAYGTAD